MVRQNLDIESNNLLHTLVTTQTCSLFHCSSGHVSIMLYTRQFWKKKKITHPLTQSEWSNDRTGARRELSQTPAWSNGPHHRASRTPSLIQRHLKSKSPPQTRILCFVAGVCFPFADHEIKLKVTRWNAAHVWRKCNSPSSRFPDQSLKFGRGVFAFKC